MSEFEYEYVDSESVLSYKIHPDCKNKNAISAPAKPGDVGFDLAVWTPDIDVMLVQPQQMVNVRTGVFLKLPTNTWGDIRPRSSTFAKRQLFVMPATIDNGYTGEISVFIWNPTNKSHELKNGDRVAQLVVIPARIPILVPVRKLPETQRGDTGFGSTGG